MTETTIGPIVRLQVQRATVKRKGEGYDPGPILSVAEAAIGPLGVVGRHHGGWVLDVHHGAHPAGRAGGRRPLSIGFTEHYRRMADRFGLVPLGCAGENVIVAVDRTILPADLEGRVVILAEDGEVPLADARVSAPCVEFTSFLLGRDGIAPRPEVADDLTFLDGGTRGYILQVAHLERSVVVRVGDRVVVR